MAPTKTLMTAQEFWNRGKATDCHELVRGELVPMTPPDKRHGVVCVNIAFLLKAYTKQVGRGAVMSNDAGILTEKNPDSVRGMDVALFLRPSWAGGPIPEGYSDEPPDVVAEVRSPSQTWASMVTKVDEYLSLGVRLVWVADPKTKRVTVFTPDHEPRTLAAENEIDGGDVLPGFRCPVADFFEGT